MGARLYRRGKIFYCWVPVLGGGTRLVSTNCTDRKAAELRAAELEQAALDPRRAAANKATVREACDAFLAGKKRAGKADGTMHFYGIKLGHAVRLLPARLAQLDDVSVLERYADSRESEGAARTTVAKEIRAVGTMLRDAKKRKLWLGDVDAVLPDYADDYKPRERRLSTDEFRSLLYAIAQPDNAQEAARAFNRAAMVAFMVITGARWSEVCRAELKDIDLATGHILLRGSKTKKAKAGRRVPITRLVSEFLGACIMPVVRDRRSGPLFDRWTNVWRDLGVACDQAKILRVTANDLRRTFGGWLRAAGVAPDLIGDAMGHVDSRMVLRVYGRLKPGELKGLLDATIAPQLTVGHVSGDADETHPNQE